VRNIEDRDALRLERADAIEQPLDLAIRQRGRRLIHDQDA